jgi:toxin ParE1/3/4
LDIAGTDGEDAAQEAWLLKHLPVRWSISASNDLIEIEFVEQDRPAAARQLGRAILQRAAALRRNPQSGRIVSELWELGIANFRQVMVPPYRLIYAVRAGTIHIEAVIDCRRDVQAVVFQRLLR